MNVGRLERHLSVLIFHLNFEVLSIIFSREQKKLSIYKYQTSRFCYLLYIYSICTECVKMKKKRQNFTIDVELLEWLRSYAMSESRTMSSLINSLVLELKRKQTGSQHEGGLPNKRNTLKSTRN